VLPGAALALLVALAGATIASCYDVPRPDCGFVCGPDGACPEGYRCASDMRCHRDGAPAGLECRTPDAALPADAAVDAAEDTAAATDDAAASTASTGSPRVPVDLRQVWR